MLTKIADFLFFIGAAMVAAKLLADFAHIELGMARQVVREDALLAALLCSVMLGVALFSDRFGKRK